MIKLADKTANIRSVLTSPDPTWPIERKVGVSNLGHIALSTVAGV